MKFFIVSYYLIVGDVQPQKKEATKFFGLSALSTFLSNKMFLNFLPQSARESGQDETFHPFHLFLSKHGHSNNRKARPKIEYHCVTRDNFRSAFSLTHIEFDT